MVMFVGLFFTLYFTLSTQHHNFALLKDFHSKRQQHFTCLTVHHHFLFNLYFTLLTQHHNFALM